MSDKNYRFYSPVKENDLNDETGQEINQNDPTDDISGSPNNSFINKVKNQFANILPTGLSKWFVSEQNDSINGNLNASGTESRKRRYEEDNSEDESNIENTDEETSEGETNNDDISDEDETVEPTSKHNNLTIASSALNKRPRLDIELSNLHNSSLLTTHQQHFVSSTPNVDCNLRRDISLPPTSSLGPLHTTFHSHNRIRRDQTNQRFISNTRTANKNRNMTEYTRTPTTMQQKNEVQSSRRTLNIPPSTQNLTDRYQGLTNLKRQSLDSVKCETSIVPSIPIRSSTKIFDTNTQIDHQFQNERNMNFMNSYENNDDDDEDDEDDEDDDDDDDEDDDDDDEDEDVDDNVDADDDDDNVDEIADAEVEIVENTTKQLSYEPNRILTTATKNYNGIPTSKTANGILDADEQLTTNIIRDSSPDMSEAGVGGGSSGVGVTDNNAAKLSRKSGLFNRSTNSSRANSRNSLCTSSLNFNTHLEGRKSLFSSNLNNSTLSLNSFNRPQFKESIYGSTSALSDSRLLNIYSPFYKGRTTYGGAAAYNNTKKLFRTGAGTSSTSISATRIRPTSSLIPTNNSHEIEDNSQTTTTLAQKILDVVNEFQTPLGDAKKLSNILRGNISKMRLNDKDLNASRLMKISQKQQTPYMRPKVLLQPIPANGKKTQLPSIRELQIPTVAQLVQLHKMKANANNGNVENVRLLEKGNTRTENEYKLPNEEINININDEYPKSMHHEQIQKHTNKIKCKISSSSRISKAIHDHDELPTEVHLPNIQFPLMENIPKIDINLPISTPAVIAPISNSLGKSTTIDTIDASEAKTKVMDIDNAFNKYSTKINDNTTTTTTITDNAIIKNDNLTKNFIFSQSVELNDVNTVKENISPINKHFTFSLPAPVESLSTADDVMKKIDDKICQPIVATPEKVPQLKSGSVLDALKKPFIIPTSKTNDSLIPISSTSNSTAIATTSNLTMSLNDMFKKSSNEWDCDVCMVRNKQEFKKCISCETPRKTTTTTATTAIKTTISNNIDTHMATSTVNATATIPKVSSSFGTKFKMSSNEWECDACMLRNKNDVNKCVACETLRKGATTTTTTTTTITSSNTTIATTSIGIAPIKNTFGDKFKLKDKWECGSCMVYNTNDVEKCISCESMKTGIQSNNKIEQTKSMPSFKFGFDNNNKLPPSDNTFKKLANEQLKSIWECNACMTRNKIGENNCVCCDEPKPDVLNTNKDVPIFGFGATASSKFKFGFANTTQNDISQLNKTTNKTETDPKISTGFVFGNAITLKPDLSNSTEMSKSKTFSFGFPAKESTNSDNLINKENSNSSLTTTNTITTTTTTTFKFGTGEQNTTSNTNIGFVFGASTNEASKMTTTTITTPTTITTSNETTTNNKSFIANISNLSGQKSFTFGVVQPSNINESKTINTDDALNKPITSVPSFTANPKFCFGTSLATSTFGTGSNTETTTTTDTGNGFKFPTSKFQMSFSQNSTTSNASANANANATATVLTNSSATVSSPAIFGSLGTSATNTILPTNTTNMFSSVTGNQNQQQSSQSDSEQPQQKLQKTTNTNSTAIFGSATNNLTTSVPGFFGSLTATSCTLTSSTSTGNWSKPSFVFGSNASVPIAKVSTTEKNSTASNLTSGFGSDNNSSVTSLVFGSGGSVGSGSVTAPVFGTNNIGNSGFGQTNITTTPNAALNNISAGATPIFGSISSTQNATNIFGSSSSSSTTIHDNTISTLANTTPLFSFGNTAFTPASGVTGLTNKSAEPAFNFGNNTQQGANMGFNFTALNANNKPAYNFGSSNQPSFNFTGTLPEATTTNAPFQFGAGAAGSATAATNIFAPTPAPASQAGQQVRRKIRTSIRRLTPR